MTHHASGEYLEFPANRLDLFGPSPTLLWTRQARPLPNSLVSVCNNPASHSFKRIGGVGDNTIASAASASGITDEDAFAGQVVDVAGSRVLRTFGEDGVL